MNATRLVAFALFSIALSGVSAQAQTVRTVSPPAETPAAGYGGTQYVDSRGCLYVRVDRSSRIAWAPGITRAGSHICDRTPTTGVALNPNDRIVPRHVYDNRRNTTNVSVPRGYRTVWTDDRLNPHRVEISPRPAVAVTARTFRIPRGYRIVRREDDRLNPNRGPRSLHGDGQSDLIWQQDIPRELVREPTNRPVVTLPADPLLAATGDEAGFLRVTDGSDTSEGQ